jgi:hypothetical protein
MRSLQGLCNRMKELGAVFTFALVLVVAARLDALRLNMLPVKHQDVGLRLVHPDKGVKSAHGDSCC